MTLPRELQIRATMVTLRYTITDMLESLPVRTQYCHGRWSPMTDEVGVLRSA